MPERFSIHSGQCGILRRLYLCRWVCSVIRSCCLAVQVASTTFQNEQIVLWGMHKINKDPSWRVSECEDALMQR